MELTVFTPTYNRAKELRNLYDSLVKQTNQDFVWLIVDDGSADETCELVRCWMAESKITIQYLYQENRGKCAALKNGIDHCGSDWFICVDSDDTLRCDAVQLMWDDIQSKNKISRLGFIYPQNMGDEAKEKWIPDGIARVSIVDMKNLYGITETAILFRTEYLKRIEFPVFENEKFLSEEVLYIQLARFGEFIPRKNAFYLSAYQDTGLTRNLFRHWVCNPRGTLCLLTKRFEYSQRYGFWIRLRERVKCIMNLNALCMVCGLPIAAHTPSIAYSAVLFIPSMLWKKLRFQR